MRDGERGDAAAGVLGALGAFSLFGGLEVSPVMAPTTESFAPVILSVTV